MSLSPALLAHLPPAWPDLPADALPMQGRAWTYARTASVPLPPAHRFPAVQDGDGALAALAPLVRVGDWWRELPLVYEPGDLIARDPAALEALADLLAGQAHPVYLERVPADSPTLPALRRAYGGRVRTRPAMPTPVLALGPAWAEGDAAYNPGRRSDFRRLERRAGAFGDITYELHAPSDAEQLAPLLEAIWSVESRSWKEAEGSSLHAHAWQGAFFQRFMLEAAQDGQLRIALLRLGGQVAAMQVALDWQGRYWLLKISHDESCARCSPGQLLLRYSLREAARRGLTACEFLGVMADWTRLWTRQTRSYLQVRAYPLNLGAGLTYLRRGARTLLRR